MKVKVRAVLLHDGRLVISREQRQGVEHVSLPGGRVRDGEPITQALIREVREETGLRVMPLRLLYVAEVVGMYGVHDLNLVWLVELSGRLLAVDEKLLAPLDGSLADVMMPPLVEQIAEDVAAGWPETALWLGNVRRAPRSSN